MSNNRKKISFIAFLIVLSIFSGIITYRIAMGKGSEKPTVQSNHEKDHTDNNSDKGKNTEHKESDIQINDIFNSIEKLHVKANQKSSDVAVELSGKDKGLVVANFKALSKKMIEEAEFKEEISDFNSYNYEIDLSSKNIRIKFFPKRQYITVENIENTKYIYKLEKEEFQSFMVLLDDIYIDKLIQNILYPIPDKIYLNAEDENALYAMSKNEIKDLMSKFKVESIEDSQEYIGTPTMYPDYSISFKRDDHEYSLHLKNNELMIINTPNVYLYCKYDEDLWNYVEKKLPRENNAREDELKFLMKSEKVKLRDLDGIYDFQNDSYYNIEIPRQILKSDLKKIGSLGDITIEEELELVLNFLVNGKSKEVLIYSNHIVYEESIYYSRNIKEHIVSTLIVP